MKLGLGLLLAGALTCALHELARVAPGPPSPGGVGTVPADIVEPTSRSIPEVDAEPAARPALTF